MDGGEPDQDVLEERERVDRILDGAWTGPAPAIAAQVTLERERWGDGQLAVCVGGRVSGQCEWSWLLPW